MLHQTNQEDNESLSRNILTSVSHDLKTPLVCIIGSLEIVERAKYKLTPKKRNIILNTALQEAYRLNGFITNILDMAKFEQKMVTPLLQSHEIKPLLNDCLITMGLQLEGRDLQVKEPAEPVICMTDSILLSRAICILLDNAAKYCSDTPSIEVEYGRTREQIVISIKDNGPGIPKAKMKEIFSKYSRIAKQDYQIAGTGLGLPICKEIMNLLNGTIIAKNLEGGKGTIFTLAFA